MEPPYDLTRSYFDRALDRLNRANLASATVGATASAISYLGSQTVSRISSICSSALAAVASSQVSSTVTNAVSYVTPSIVSSTLSTVSWYGKAILGNFVPESCASFVKKSNILSTNLAFISTAFSAAYCYRLLDKNEAEDYFQKGNKLMAEWLKNPKRRADSIDPLIRFYYTEAAKRGHPRAMHNLSVLYQLLGDNLRCKQRDIRDSNHPSKELLIAKLEKEIDLFLECDWFWENSARLCKNKFAWSCYDDEITKQYQYGRYLSSQKIITGEFIKSEAEKGNVPAMVNLGILYEKADDIENAKKWYLAAMKFHSSRAALRYGHLVAEDENVDKKRNYTSEEDLSYVFDFDEQFDQVEAQRKIFSSNSKNAISKLAETLYVQRKFSEAAVLLQLIIDTYTGKKFSELFTLSQMYRNGLGVPVDTKKADHLFSLSQQDLFLESTENLQSAEQSNLKVRAFLEPSQQRDKAFIATKKSGFGKKERESKKKLLEEIVNEYNAPTNLEAVLNLGALYEEEGNYSKAFDTYFKTLGTFYNSLEIVPEIRLRLARMYEAGKGVPQNSLLALHFYKGIQKEDRFYNEVSHKVLELRQQIEKNSHAKDFKHDISIQSAASPIKPKEETVIAEALFEEGNRCANANENLYIARFFWSQASNLNHENALLNEYGIVNGRDLHPSLAIGFFAKNEKIKSTHATFLEGIFYLTNDAFKDIEYAQECFEKASREGHQIAKMYNEILHKSNDERIIVLEREEFNENSMAQFLLAQCYRIKNDNKAKKTYIRAIELDVTFRRKIIESYLSYLKREIFPEIWLNQHQSGIGYESESFKKEYTQDVLDLANWCLKSNDNKNEAVKWFELAAKYGNVEALYMLGKINEDGIEGIEAIKMDDARNYYRQAAEKGHEPAKKKCKDLQINFTEPVNPTPASAAAVAIPDPAASAAALPATAAASPSIIVSVGLPPPVQANQSLVDRKDYKDEA